MCLFANLKSIGLAYESIVLVDVSEYCMKWSMWRTGDIPFHLFLCLFIFLKEVHTTPQTIVPSQSDVVYSWTTKWIVVRVGWGIGKRRYEYKSKYSLGIDLTDCTKSMICCFTVNCAAEGYKSPCTSSYWQRYEQDCNPNWCNHQQ